MKLNNKGFAFSTMLYGTLAVITVVLYAILTISKETVDETYYYGTDIEKKLNECIQDEIEMEKCYTNNQNGECNTASYHACLGISDNTSTNNGMLAAEKLKQIANSGEENLSIIQDPYTEKRYIYVGTDGNGKVVNNYIEYANKVKEELQKAGIRVEVDTRQEKIGYKIREAQLSKTPYMLIIGDKEKEANSVGVRSRKDGDIGAQKLEEFVSKIKKEVNTFAK